MPAVLTVLELARAGIEDTRSGGKGGEGLLQPGLTVEFVYVFAEHRCPFSNLF
jgi:hypothetical protein